MAAPKQNNVKCSTCRDTGKFRVMNVNGFGKRKLVWEQCKCSK